MATGKIGHYTIVSELGRGGMGVVYKAHEESLNRFVAIKVLGEQLSGDPSFVTRFVREAQAAAALSHPNIIQIFFIGEDNGRHYFVMEYVKGKSLLAMVKEEGKIDNPRATQYMLQAANGLAVAHDRGFLHRDIKPANLLVDESGLLKIADFGLALPQDAATRLTATGMLVGTPGYLSPEQCMAQPVDQRTDIYSLGVTFYEVLSGRMPFQADSPLALLRKILHEEPPDITTLNQAVDEKTRGIVHRMIAKDRDQRYQSCHELVADLEECLGALGVRVASRGLAGAGAAAAAAATGGAARRDPTLPSAFELAGETERMPSGAPPAAPGQAGVVFPSSEAAPPRAVASGAAPAAAASALVPAPQALPVPASVARGSKAPVVIVAVIGVTVVALAVALFLAVRSPLVRRFLPWGGPSAQARQAGKAAPVPGASTGLGTREAGETRQGQPAGPAGTGRQTQAAAGESAAAAAAASQGTARLSPPQVEAPQGSSRGGSRAAPRGAAAVSAAAARAQEQQPAPALAGVAVAAVGEQLLVGTVSSFVQSELQAAGLQPLDAATLPATEGLVRGEGEPGTEELIRALRGAGVAVLALARVVPAGQRELQYMDRYDVAYSSRVTVTCYDVATGRPRGRSLSATIEYTTLTIERSTERALGPLAREIAQQVR
ncbi:MAG: serine/threonine protein kinase [Thermoanaerobaculaceae bacterium]|nr:serine/threonine protein kinase [Thermoanaerobaculaceae bacterium]